MDAILHEIYRRANLSGCGETTEPYLGWKEIVSIIKDTPAADVVEVRHGYWLFTEYEFFNCSICGEAYYNSCESTKEAKHRLETKYDLYKYCPHCGAKMDSEPQKINK